MAELKVAAKGNGHQVAAFDHLGDKGWELMSQANGTTNSRMQCTFKRRK